MHLERIAAVKQLCEISHRIYYYLRVVGMFKDVTYIIYSFIHFCKSLFSETIQVKHNIFITC